jgi:N-acetylglucosamine kinase-like BadF-type ATPase
MYTGRIAQTRIGELSRVVFAAAEAGDAAARRIVDRLADEIVAMAGAMLRRSHLTRRDPDVVLAGGVFRTRDPMFAERIASGVRAIAPRAGLVRLSAPPVAGAALLGLDRLAGDAVSAETSAAVRVALGRWDLDLVSDARLSSGGDAPGRSTSSRAPRRGRPRTSWR